MMAPRDTDARVLRRRSIYRGAVIDLRVEDVRLPNGYEGTLEIIAHPGAAAVVPVTESGEVVMVRQYRHAVGRWLLEVPAGKLDSDEKPETCARRECAEEVGLRPRRLTPLGAIYPTPGFADEKISLYLGTDLEAVPTAHEEDEVLEIVRLPLEAAVEQAVTGTMPDSKSAIAILRAAHALRMFEENTVERKTVERKTVE